MASTKNIKLTLLGVFIVLFAVWLVSGTLSNAVGLAPPDGAETPGIVSNTGQDDYVGSETCRACHASQFDKVANTKHGKLGTSAKKVTIISAAANIEEIV